MGKYCFPTHLFLSTSGKREMKNRISLLVVWRGFFPSLRQGFAPGPTSPIAYEIFRRIRDKACDVKIICWHSKSQPHRENVEEIEVARIKKPFFRRFSEQVLGLKMSARAVYEIVRRKVNLLHIMGEPVWHGWSLFIARLLRMPVVMSFLDAWYPLEIYEREPKGNLKLPYLLFNREALIPFLEKLYAQYASKIIVVTDDLKRYYMSLGISERKIIVIPNAASIRNSEEQKLSILKDIYGLEEKDIVIGYLGGIRKIHGVEILIRSFVSLAMRYKDIKLIYIGDGVDLESLKSQRPKELENRIIFSGEVSYDEVPNYLCLIDCGFISWEDNLAMSCASPLKLFEYMAAKKPVIGGCTGQIREIIEKSNGGIFMRERTIGCAIDALERFINLPASEKGRLGENGYRYVIENHSWTIVAKKYEEVYKDLID